MDLYKKTTLSNKVLAQCLVALTWRNRKEISKYIVNDRVNKDNADEFIKEFVDYSDMNNIESDDYKEIYDLLLKKQNK